MQLSYVDQHRHDLGAENTVFQEVTGGTEHIEVAGKTIISRAYVGRFNFKGPDPVSYTHLTLPTNREV